MWCIAYLVFLWIGVITLPFDLAFFIYMLIADVLSHFLFGFIRESWKIWKEMKR